MLHYIISAFRHYRKNRFFLALNLISLVLGMLVCSSIMLISWQQLRTDHFISSANRIYRLNCGGYGVTPLCFKDLIGSAIPEIEESTRLCGNELEIDMNNEQATINKIYYTDPNVFSLFELKLIAGSRETALKDPFSIVITESLANRIFGSKQVVGKTILHNKKYAFTITGVMKDLPVNSHLKINGLASIQTLPLVTNNAVKLEDCGSWYQLTYLKLKKENQKVECEKKINFLLEDHKMGTRDGKIPLKLEALTSIYFNAEGNKFDGTEHGNLLIILAFAALGILTLIISVINSINFSLAQSIQRSREINTMRIYGASKMQITSKLVIEMLIVFQCSSMIASLLQEFSLPFFLKQIGFETGFPENRLPFYLICFGISTLLGFIAGLFPAFYHHAKPVFRSVRISQFRSMGQKKGILMILIQYMLTTVFLISAYIVIHQINFMLKKDPGFRPANVLQIDLDNSLAANYDLLKKRLLEEPGIKKVAFSDAWFGEGLGKKPVGEKGKEILCNFIDVDPDYFDVMGISIKTGRNYSWQNPSDTVKSIILNETAARAFELSSGTGEIFGKQILTGITGDFNFSSLKNGIEPLMIRCLKAKPSVISVQLSGNNQKGNMKKIIHICNEISPNFHKRISFLTESLQKYYSVEMKLSRGIMLYAIIAFALSILGIIGICTITLQNRRKEMAIRRLNGASITENFILILWDFTPWVFLANLFSVPLTIYLARLWLQSYAYQAPLSPIVFILSASVILVITAIIIIIVSYKSCKSNPAEVLHEE